jgi:hypothetical protein
LTVFQVEKHIFSKRDSVLCEIHLLFIRHFIFIHLCIYFFSRMSSRILWKCMQKGVSWGTVWSSLWLLLSLYDTWLFSKRNDSGPWGLRLILESHEVNITFQMLIWNDLNYSLRKLKAYNSFHTVISRKYHVFRQSDKKNIYSHIIINSIPWLVHVYILESY